MFGVIYRAVFEVGALSREMGRGMYRGSVFFAIRRDTWQSRPADGETGKILDRFPCRTGLTVLFCEGVVMLVVKYRERHIERKLREYSEFFKVVLVVGARQVGKSSLLGHVFPDVKSFVFYAVQDIHGVRRDPDLFLDNFPYPLILDEIQHVPELLSAAKRRVDKVAGSGMYLMTGSQKLSVLRQVSESLAGRVASCILTE